MAEPLMSQSQGLVTKLQSVGDTLEFWTEDMPDGVSRFRVSNFGFFATILLAAVSREWPVAVSYPTKGDPIRDVVALVTPS